MSSFDLKSASMGETKEPGFTTKDKNVIQNLSLKTADKRRHNLDMIKVQVICSLLCNNLYQLKILQEAATASLMIGKLGNEKLIRCSVECLNSAWHIFKCNSKHLNILSGCTFCVA